MVNFLTNSSENPDCLFFVVIVVVVFFFFVCLGKFGTLDKICSFGENCPGDQD